MTAVLPIVRKELLGSGRSGRFYLLRAVYLGLLATVAVPALRAVVLEMTSKPGFQAFSRGTDYTMRFGALQLVLVVLLAPALAISAIASEKASGVLELLHVAGVRPREIVAGKIGARVAWLGLLVLSGIPVLVAGTIMGGAGAETVALLAAHSMAAAFVGTAMGVLASGIFRHAIPAMLAAYGLCVAYYGCTLAFGAVLDVIGGTHPTWAYLSSPISAVEASARGRIGSEIAWLALLPQLVVGAVFALVAIPFAKPALEKTRGQRLGEVGVSILEKPLTASAKKRRSVSVVGNPVAWREARSHRHSFGVRIVRLAYIALGAALAVHFLVFAVLAGEHTLARIAVAVLALGAGAVTLVVASTALAGERESRAIVLLRLTRLTALDVVLGKIEGLALFLWPVVLLPVIPAIAFLALDNSAFVLSLALTGALVFSGGSIGLLFSSMFRRSVTAVIASVATVLAWLVAWPFGLLAVCGYDCRGSDQQILSIVNPIYMTTTLVSNFAKVGHRRIYAYSYDSIAEVSIAWPMLGMVMLSLVGVIALGIAVLRVAKQEEPA